MIGCDILVVNQFLKNNCCVLENYEKCDMLKYHHWFNEQSQAAGGIYFNLYYQRYQHDIEDEFKIIMLVK